MKGHWDKLLQQLDELDASFLDFLENGMLSKVTADKVKPVIKKFNGLKKQIADFDVFVSPVAPLELSYSFESEELREMWQRWKEYLSEQHGQIMRTRSEKSAMEHLNDISGGDEKKAIRYLRYAMSSRSKSFYVVGESDVKEPAKEESEFGNSFG
jgi:hypothetical protein